ncbi:FAD-dependent oxidoreductase domain-containing protein 1-like isoform X1 [Haliotis asinina]|uniref:FAD-dependent oxidoreductase domain-containing protein 1-like isoform X1 n=1 Tax=Haliotis asinina TaxID=109174 RepID=UPI003531DD16
MLRQGLRIGMRHFCSNGSDKTPPAGSFRSPWKILKEEFQAVKQGQPLPTELPVPREVDILVVGGGLIGSAVAYWIKQRHPKGVSLMVLEKDMSYTRASSTLSAGGLRHQFSLAENIQLSMFCTDFLRNIKEHLSVLDQDPPSVPFNHQGYLFLVPPDNVEQCLKNHALQTELGAKVELLTCSRLKEKFPWLNLDGVELGSYGVEGEGWFDPYCLLQAFKQKNQSLGVRYVAGELTEFDFREQRIMMGSESNSHKILDSAVIKGKDGKMYQTRFAVVINCAGAWAGDVARKAMIGLGPGDLATPLPVEPRKRYVYAIHCPDGPGVASPLTVDSTLTYYRQDGYGGHYICGCSPTEENEPCTDDLEVNYDYFHENVWPSLASRVPKFECLKLKSAWAGFYDYNTFDQNLIIGNHPYHRNMIFANGLSGHGVQHATGIGRAVMELIIDNDFKTIDLSNLGFERLIYKTPVLEQHIV